MLIHAWIYKILRGMPYDTQSAILDLSIEMNFKLFIHIYWNNSGWFKYNTLNYV